MSAAMDRRGFFKLAGVTGALLAAGGGLAACDIASSPLLPAKTGGTETLFGYSAISFSEHVDVLIVGSGLAGLSAAIDPAEAGKSVLVAEKNELLGGDSFFSNGLFYVSGTDLQLKAGITTTAADAWKARKAQLESESDTANIAFKESLMMAQTEWVDRVVADYQSGFADPTDYKDTGAAETILLPKGGIGDMSGIMTPLKEGLAAKGVVYRTSLRATAFILDAAGTACGMRLRSDTGNTNIDVSAKKIVIATGGFANNQKLIAENLAQQATLGCFTTDNAGEGITLCQSVGGQIADMGKAAPLISDIPTVSTWGLFGPTVNLDPFGKRFAREDQPGKAAGECVAHGNGFWWTLYDPQLSAKSQGRNVAQVIAKNTARSVGPFDKIEDIAEALQIPADTLMGTLEEYNGMAAAGKDTIFGRSAALAPLEAPFSAIKQFPVRYLTFGGIQTNDGGQITNVAGLAIDNVYCCGACAAGSTNGLASAAAFGMLVGRAVVVSLNNGAPGGQDTKDS